ncbi:MAG: hypothetical protein Q7R83_01960 [bacterium]|nr:hypothetical protein [bacterium]
MKMLAFCVAATLAVGGFSAAFWAMADKQRQEAESKEASALMATIYKQGIESKEKICSLREDEARLAGSIKALDRLQDGDRECWKRSGFLNGDPTARKALTYRTCMIDLMEALLQDSKKDRVALIGRLQELGASR